MAPGVSIVVCCHNSASRLRPTLEHLARQSAVPDVRWEVIVIDNGSSDNTAALAREIWPAEMAHRLRVVTEPKLGLSHARARGFAESAFEIVSLIDDDNWACPDWVGLISEIMGARPEVGALGGYCEAAFEAPPPAWFKDFSRSYAVGEMAPAAGDVTWTRGYLFGAGLTIRKSAWDSLRQAGYKPMLSDRSGKALTSGGDEELCKALRLAGWTLYYDPRLRLQHFIPSGRMKWEYLRGLRRGFGIASVTLDAYKFATKRNRLGVSRTLRTCWLFQFMSSLTDLIACGKMAFFEQQRASEGDASALAAEYALGRLSQLWTDRMVYGRRSRQLRAAPWKRVAFAPERNGQ